MIKIQYIGEDAHNLAQFGVIQPGQVFNATEKQAAGLEKHAPESYVRMSADDFARYENHCAQLAADKVKVNTPVARAILTTHDDDDEPVKPVVPATPPKAKVSQPGPRV